MARRSEAKMVGDDGSGWKSPPLGWPGLDPAQYLRLVVHFRAGTGAFLPRMHVFLRRLMLLLGDHAAELSGSVTGRAWASELPWRQKGPFWVGLRLPLSTMSEPATWRTIVEGLEAGLLPRINAFRGGGKHRHVVWELTSCDGNVHVSGAERWVFYLALRHVDRRATALQGAGRMALRFFRTVCLHAEPMEGWGEIVAMADTGHLWERDALDVRGALEAAVREEVYESGIPCVVAMRDALLLTRDQVATLGGLEALRARARDAEDSIRHPDAQSLGWEYTWAKSIRPIREHALCLDRSIIDRWRPAATTWPEQSMWLLDELIGAGLFAPARAGWIGKRAARFRRNIIESKAMQAAARQNRRKPKRDDSLPGRLRTRTPSCIRYSCEPAAEVPFERQPGDWLTAFELPARDMAPGVTIHGRRSGNDGAEAGTDGLPLLHDPVLVGSLDRERATLFLDARIHGWDGAQGEAAPEKARPLGRLKQMTCPKCQARHFRAWAIFEYPDDLAESLEGEDAERPEDFFSWFWLVARCVGCAWEGIVADVECA